MLSGFPSISALKRVSHSKIHQTIYFQRNHFARNEAPKSTIPLNAYQANTLLYNNTHEDQLPR